MAPNTEKEITMDEVKKHNTAEDCWLVIGNDATGEYRFFFYLQLSLHVLVIIWMLGYPLYIVWQY